MQLFFQQDFRLQNEIMGQVYFSTSKIDAKHNLLTKISGRQNLLNAIHMQTELFYGKTAKVQANWKMQTCSSFFNKNSESKMKYCGKPLLWLASYDVCILSSADICILASDDESWWRLHMYLQVARFTCTVHRGLRIVLYELATCKVRRLRTCKCKWRHLRTCKWRRLHTLKWQQSDANMIPHKL